MIQLIGEDLKNFITEPGFASVAISAYEKGLEVLKENQDFTLQTLHIDRDGKKMFVHLECVFAKDRKDMKIVRIYTSDDEMPNELLDRYNELKTELKDPVTP